MINKWSIAYLILGGFCFIASLVLQLAYSEAFQPAVWLLFLTLICCSLSYNKAKPRFERNIVVVIVGSSFILCTALALCAFAAGLATRSMDRVAFGIGLFVTLITLPLTVFWTKTGLPRQKTNADQQVSLVKSENDDQPASALNHQKPCLDWNGCTICANVCWILLAILIILCTSEIIGEVVDARTYLPADAFLATIPADSSETFNSSLTGTTGRDDPRIRTTHERHVVCNGTGSPLIVLEHGRGGSVWDWAWVQRYIVDHVNGTKVCAFSRSGYGFSSRGDRPRSAAQTSLELKAMLRTLDLDVPFIHAGHSWGGMAMRMYQKMYPEQVLGQVYVDAVHTPCMDYCNDKPWPSGFYRALAAIAATGIPRALALSGSLPLNGSALMSVLPEDVRGPRLSTIISPQFWQTWTDENEELSLSCHQVNRLANANVSSFKAPIRNIIAGEGIHLEEDGNYTCGRGLEQLSDPPGSSVIVEGAPHIELLFDQQFAVKVAEEILDVLQQVREAS